MENILDIVKKLAVFYVISSLLISMSSNEKYKKYISTFVGIVMIIILINPVFSLFSHDLRSKKRLSINENEIMLNEIKNEISDINSRNAQRVIEEYKSYIKKDIEEKISEYGLLLTDLEICTDIDSSGSLYIKSFVADCMGKEEGNGKINRYSGAFNPEILEIKKYISDVYKININNIYVNISG